MKSENISNEVANELYEKLLEPGFDYEESINNAGLISRELFDVVMYLLSELQNDMKRRSVTSHNVFVPITGSRSSYIAFDVATHIFLHGECIAGILSNPIETIPGSTSDEIIPTNSNDNEHTFSSYLHLDVERRFKSLYKLQSHRYKIIDIELPEDHIDNIIHTIESNNISIIVLGIYENSYTDSIQNSLMTWSAWISKLTVVFAKTQSLVRPFTSVITNKIHMICMKPSININENEISYYFRQSLLCMRPNDTFVVLVIADSRDPLCDMSYETRYDYGNRYNTWISGINDPNTTNYLGWNDESLSKFTDIIQNLINKSQMEGKLKIERCSKTRSIAQDICKYAKQENVELIITKLGRNERRDIIVGCIFEASCCVAIVK